MDHYVDINLLPDPEFSPQHLMSALYAKLHRALVAQASARIGVSFPDFDLKTPHLGKCLRLHGDNVLLTNLLSTDWLRGMLDHVSVTSPAEAPVDAKHRTVCRVQTKSNPDRLRRRLMRRHDIDALEARQRIPDDVAEFAHLPFAQMHSTSTQHTFRIFISHGPVLEKAIPGNFSTYGLSQGATVPWF
jgi:CRISPR-associated endonuclease Csy4